MGQHFDKDILVHRGFHNQFMAIEDKLTAYVDNEKENVDDIYFIGHSLGMACATLAALYYTHYLNNTKIKIHCHSFGGPRVGNKEFINFYAQQTDLIQNTYSVIDYKDPVIHLPFSYNFFHIVSPTIVLGRSGKLELRDGADTTHWLFRPFQILLWIPFPNVIKDHHIDSYIEKLQTIYVSWQENKREEGKEL